MSGCQWRRGRRFKRFEGATKRRLVAESLMQPQAPSGVEAKVGRGAASDGYDLLLLDYM